MVRGSGRRGSGLQVLGGDMAGRGFDGVRIVADGEDEVQRVPGPASKGGAERGALAVLPPKGESKALEGAVSEASDGHCRPHLALVVPHVPQRPRQAVGVAEHGLGLVGVLAVGSDDRDHHAGTAFGRAADRDRLRFSPPFGQPPAQGKGNPGAGVGQASDGFRVGGHAAGQDADQQQKRRCPAESRASDDKSAESGRHCTRRGPPIEGFSFSAMMPSRRATSV
jgi:hypothetical protein